MDGPIIEHAAFERLARRVAPPLRLAVDHRDIGAEMLTAQDLHPHMARRLETVPLVERANDAASRAHAAHIVDRLREDREIGRHEAMRRAADALALGDEQLVVDPAMRREEMIGIGVVGRNGDILRTSDAIEILVPPGIVFNDGHEVGYRRLPHEPLWCGKLVNEYFPGGSVARAKLIG